MLSPAPTENARASTGRRVGLACALTALSAAALLVAGCGERYGPGSRAPEESKTVAQAPAPAAPREPVPTAPSQTTVATSPAATSPAATTVAPTTVATLGSAATIGGVTWKPLSLYSGAVQIAARDGYFAAAVPAGPDAPAGTAELVVGRDGGVPAPADGAGPLPTWAQPHVGTDAKGRTVVTYPRCVDSAEIGTCDIYAWHATTKREVLLKAVSGPNLAETEGVMDEGSVLVVREKRRILTASEFLGRTPTLTTLVLKPLGEAQRVVTRHGGRSIDLLGDRIADVYAGTPGDAGTCGVTEARALDLKGLTVAARQVICGENGSRAIGTSLAPGHLRLAITANNGKRVALDHDLATGATMSAPLTQPFDWFVADRATTGYAIRSASGNASCSAAAAAATGNACRLSKVSGLQWTAVSTNWRISGGQTPVKE